MCRARCYEYTRLAENDSERDLTPVVFYTIDDWRDVEVELERRGHRSESGNYQCVMKYTKMGNLTAAIRKALSK